MAHYKVKWYSDPRDPRSSTWYELGGTITAASNLLKDWIGGSHRTLINYLRKRGLEVYRLSNDCVPPTVKYHQQLKDCTDALIKLLEPKDED